MKNVMQSGDMVKVGKAGKKAEIMEIAGAVTQVRYNDGKIGIVPTSWIRD
jgi:hypothetical protein